jgi:hypothetical protein
MAGGSRDAREATTVNNRLLGLTAILAATLSLASCGTGSPSPGASSSPESGVYGISLVNQGGMMTALPSPSPLPGGFGPSLLVPDPHHVVLVRVAGGPDAGKLIARVRSDAQGLFRVALPPGRYLVKGPDIGSDKELVSVRAGGYSRVRLKVATRH